MFRALALGSLGFEDAPIGSDEWLLVFRIKAVVFLTARSSILYA